jgi:hypothetical protein
LGISNRHHFDWLTGALARFECETLKGVDVHRARAGKHLIDADLMEQVVFRHARYFYRHVGKFNEYLLTVLEPVGKYDTWRRA